MKKKEVKDNDVSKKIQEFKEENNRIKGNKIESTEELRESYEQAKALYKEIIRNLPLVTSEMAKRGMNLVINEVEQKIDNQKRKIIEKATSIKTEVKETGKNIKDKVVEKKDEIKDKVVEKKDEIKDKAYSAKEGAKKTIKDEANKVKSGVKSTIQGTKTNIKNKAQNARDRVTDAKDAVHGKIENIKDSLEEDEIYKSGLEIQLDNMSNKKREEIAEWKEKNAGRNKTIVSAAEKISLTALKMKTIKHSIGIKLTTVATKGARLVGKKDQAREMAESRSTSLKDEMAKDTRIGRFARNLAKSIFEKSDKAKDFIEEKKENIKAGAERVETFLKEDAIEGVKKGAFAIGKGGYKGAALVTGLGELAIEGVKGAAENAGEKISKTAKKTGKKISEKAEEVKENAIDKKDIGKNYIEMAGKKIQLTQTKAKMGIKGFFKGVAEGVLKRIEPSLDNDKSKQESLEQGIETNRENINNIRNKDVEADGPEIG